ncbi:MAG: histidinol-phosphatase [Granulosicoccus sp.]
MTSLTVLPRHEPTAVSQTELCALSEAAQRAADAAAEVTMQYFRNEMHVLNKAGTDNFDPVTAADRSAELAIRDSLYKEFPGIGFFGEEHAATKGSSGLLWVVDPIDGTRAFMSGMPLWGTLIGLYNGRDAILGVMDQPFLQERYVGDGKVAHVTDHLGRHQLTTRNCSDLALATLYCTTPDMFAAGVEQDRFQTVRQSVQLTRYGGDCYAYALLAAGHVDIVLDGDLKPYDIQALIPIVEGAGGIVSNWQGDSAVDGGLVVACGNRAVHESVIALLQG